MVISSSNLLRALDLSQAIGGFTDELISVREERHPPARPLRDGGGNDPAESTFMRILRSGGQHVGPTSSINDADSARDSNGIRFDGSDVSSITGRGIEGAEVSSNAVLAISPHLDFHEFIRRQQGWLSVHKAR